MSAPNCPRCGRYMLARSRITSDLDGFLCPHCGYSRSAAAQRAADQRAARLSGRSPRGA